MKLYKEMRDRMIKFFAKWLPIFFGCHCLPERSFFIKGKQFPICSRCTGILVGIFLAICTFFFRANSNILLNYYDYSNDYRW